MKKEKAQKKTEGLAKNDLAKKVASLKEELFNLKVQNLSGSLEDNSKIRAARREVARLLTQANMSAQGK
jgi:large subunit ribosomal protein L29